MVAFPQNASRMQPGTQRFFELVVNKKIRHDGNPSLARHLDNAKLKADARGARLIKEAHDSPRKIDLAVAAVMAVDRAAFWLMEDPPGTFMGVKIEDIAFIW